MLLYIMMYIVLAYLMLYIMLAYLMLFAALSNAVCLHNAFLPFFLMIFANAFCFIICFDLMTHSFFFLKNDFPSCAVLLICWFFLILCSNHFYMQGLCAHWRNST